MTASMQAVIQKLREQEKELAALHRARTERAQQTERLSEAVTRNMPAGLAADQFRRADHQRQSRRRSRARRTPLPTAAKPKCSEASRALTSFSPVAWRTGRTFRREEVEYTTPQRRIAPARRDDFADSGQAPQVTGALCLLSDLTELAALQRQVQVKENLAALGELSAGIAHEFKNALATISGYAQMIRSESGETAENAQLILEQTRALTHVVTEFLKFARPLGPFHEKSRFARWSTRAITEIREAIPDVAISSARRI